MRDTEALRYIADGYGMTLRELSRRAGMADEDAVSKHLKQTERRNGSLTSEALSKYARAMDWKLCLCKGREKIELDFD